MLLAMALSCHIIPDHNPGDDVLRFDMRLRHGDENCFCLKGHLCEKIMISDVDEHTTDTCAIHSVPSSGAPFWKFWLSPLTKWDAARFLNLAVQPSLRDPQCLQSGSDCSFAASEQAHAFFPMYPLVVARLALVLYQIIPAVLLPPTFEALVTLSGFLVNLLCWVIATWSLYDLTFQILATSDLDKDQRHGIAVASCLVYGIWNPASIFFVTNYSESLFTACTLWGHALFQKRQTWSYPFAILIWMIGSYTRSNGTLQFLWLIQFALGSLARCSPSQNNLSSVYGPTLVVLLAAVCVALPAKYHDWQGYHRHCGNQLTSKPEWCSSEDDAGFSFSLYGWTQREHWNVGFFRYYQWKQIPNFFLAAPILGLSLKGVIQWIYYSLVTDFGKGKLPVPRLILVDWPLHALSEAVGSGTKSPLQLPAEEWLVHNPLLLGHYAILTIVTLVGIAIAHVQISTRMICSSCPAIIWYLTYSMIQDKHPRLRVTILLYTILYILLGILLHVNFLPWT
jgi:phosphatidylinositol glycan class V